MAVSIKSDMLYSNELRRAICRNQNQNMGIVILQNSNDKRLFSIVLVVELSRLPLKNWVSDATLCTWNKEMKEQENTSPQ